MSRHLEVSLGLWQDRPPQEALATARLADRLGYDTIWVGEMATWDAFALATHLGTVTERSRLVVGPLAVTVRDPAMIAMGAASVANLTGRDVGVALGTSSTTVVERWHGRERRRTGRAIEESARAVRLLLDGDKAEVPGEVVRTSGYRLRLPPPRSELVVAAFGPQAVATAARHADRMVLNLVDPPSVARLVEQLHTAAAHAGRPAPRVAVWAVCAVDPGPSAVDQLRRAVVGYLGAPGYSEMFRAAGFGELVDYAATRPHPGELLTRVPAALFESVGIVGDRDRVARRMAAYSAAGADDIVVVPSATEDDPAGERTLRAALEIAAQ